MPKLIFNKDEPIRLDYYLSNLTPALSRSFIAKLIDSGHILVNNTVSKPSLKLKKGDAIIYDDESLVPPSPPAIEIPIIYEDDFCLVLNKPSGIITHAKGALTNEGSVASYINDKISDQLVGNRAGIVHRLDRGTSGVIVAAKSPEALKYLQRQFAKRQTRKTYVALVEGVMDKDKAIINMPIERNPKKPSTFRVGASGKSAETMYQVIATNDQYSLLKLIPKTGRTHQLRVHLKALGHPIVGDDLYNGLESNRLMLHAYELELTLPDIGRISFKADIPIEYSTYINYDHKDL